MTTLLLALLCAFSVSFVWKPSPDPRMTNTPSGYIMVWGHSSGAYTSSTNVGNVTGFTLDLNCGTNYVAVYAYAGASLQSDLSNEVSVIVTNLSAPIGLLVTPK